MFVLRAILIALLMALSPAHPLSAHEMPAGTAAATAHDATAHQTMDLRVASDCCQDGSHQMPSCQMQTVLRDEAMLPPLSPRATALHPAPPDASLAGRFPDLLLPPPRSA